MKILMKILIPLIVLAVGFVITAQLVKTRKKPERAAPQETITPVSITTVQPERIQLQIDAAGTVTPSQEVVVRPQVSGQIVEMHNSLLPGGYVAAGELLAKVDPRDYEYALEQQQAALAQAELALTEEQGRAAVAEREWELLGAELQSSEAGKALALRQPQLQQARAQLAAARGNVAQAKLNLERTEVRAPFNALIRNESVDLGQLATPQDTIATLTGTDRYWVRAALPVAELSMFDLPSLTGESGAMATVIHETGTGEIRREGRVVRLLGDLEESGRLARVLIEIADPLGLEGDKQPLLLGSYVRVEVQGRGVDELYAVPAQAIREGDQAWVMSAENRLEIRNVRVMRRFEQTAFVKQGLSPGDRVITSRISAPTPGMKLQLVNGEKKAAPLKEEAAVE